MSACPKSKPYLIVLWPIGAWKYNNTEHGTVVTTRGSGNRLCRARIKLTMGAYVFVTVSAFRRCFSFLFFFLNRVNGYYGCKRQRRRRRRRLRAGGRGERYVFSTQCLPAVEHLIKNDSSRDIRPTIRRTLVLGLTPTRFSWTVREHKNEIETNQVSSYGQTFC